MTYPIDTAVKPEVEAFFDPATNTISYIVKDPGSDACALVDTVMDFDYASGRLTFDSADRLIARVRERGLRVEWILETHVHADHLSAAPYIQKRLGGRIGIGARITTVQETFGKVFNEGTEFRRDGSQFDALFEDGDTFEIGTMTAFAMHTPGHTPACMVYVMGDAAVVGDTLFMPDGGSARADFPGGDAGELYDSIQKVLALPGETRLLMCHDYGPGGREIAWETTVAEQRAANIHVGGGRSREAFVAFRERRDAQLKVPGLIIPSLQVNMRAGEVPTDAHGNPVMKVPVNGL
jgi:glyoxylase-like metal-dependent hydrolase (beta-lactamase superfamily II)